MTITAYQTTTYKPKIRAVRWIYQSLLIELSEPCDRKIGAVRFQGIKDYESAKTFGVTFLQINDSQTNRALKVPNGTFYPLTY